MAAEASTSFKDLGLIDELCEACEAMGWKEPTPIQRESLPVAFKGKDIIGLAETGSGKTGAFGLPLLQALLLNPQRYFGLILTPTRELAIQIKEQLDSLGKEFGLHCCAVVGGVDAAQQALALMKRPHIIVATLGRLADQIKNLKGFSSALGKVKFLVMDEADRILSMDFEEEVDCVIRTLPKKRTTMLFSATITNKVKELQRAHLGSAVRLEVNTVFKIVDSLKQYVLPVVLVQKNLYLVYILSALREKSVIVFCNTRANTLKTALIVRQCGHKAIPLYGDMTQAKRLDALAKFKEKTRSILVATDVASRGLDIPCVDYVILFEVPAKSEDYIHRVGRTARAGRPGVSITVVSQYEMEDFLRIEQLVGQHSLVKRIPVYETIKEEVLKCDTQVAEAEKTARLEMRRIEDLRRAHSGRGGSDDEDDTEESRGVRRRLKGTAQEKRKGAHAARNGPNRSKRGRRK